MTNEPDWIKNLVPPDDVAEIEATAEKIVEAHGTFYEMTVMMSQEDMIEAVRAGADMQEGIPEAWVIGVGILMSLLETMRIALEADNIQIWED